MPLRARQRREDLAGHLVGDRDGALRQPTYRRGLGGRAERPGCQDQDGAPALPESDDLPHDLGVGVPQMCRHERRRLRVGHPEQVATDHREEAQQLRNDPGERDVLPADEEQAHRRRLVQQALVHQPHARRGQLVGSVDHDQPRQPSRGRPGTDPLRRAVQNGLESRGREVSVGLQPDRTVEVVSAVAHPAGDAQGLAGAGGAGHHGHAQSSDLVEPVPEPVPGYVAARRDRHGAAALPRNAAATAERSSGQDLARATSDVGGVHDRVSGLRHLGLRSVGCGCLPSRTQRIDHMSADDGARHAIRADRGTVGAS